MRRESSRPELPAEALPVWDAFAALQGDRPIVGMAGALGDIPFTAIDAYARRYDISGEDFEWLRQALASLMERQFRHEAARREREAARKQNQPGTR